MKFIVGKYYIDNRNEITYRFAQEDGYQLIFEEVDPDLNVVDNYVPFNQKEAEKNLR